MRLDKYVNDCTGAGRSAVRRDIRSGRITVNGDSSVKPEMNVDPSKYRVCCSGTLLEYVEYHYFMMNKPAGLISARTDNREKAVIELMPARLQGTLAPVGRLDKDTEGLLIITDDGMFAHNLISPKKHVDKKYNCELRTKLPEYALHKLESGVDIGDNDPTLPAKAEYADKSRKSIYLTIHEGRFHQVKRMLFAVDNEVVYLKRVSIGDILLDPGLKKGEYRPLTPEELQSLKNAWQ